MAFDVQTKITVWQLFQLPKEELNLGSCLRKSMLEIEQCDIQNGTDIVGEIEGLILQIQNLDRDIEQLKKRAGIKREKLEMVKEIEYRDSNDQLNLFFNDRNNLMNRLAELLGIDIQLGGFAMSDLAESL